MGFLNNLDMSAPVQDSSYSPGIVLGTVEDLLNWGRAKSDWYLQFGLACCAIEFMALNAAHFDFMRFGCIPRTSPRQADFIIISGTVTFKMAERIYRLYEQMAEPRYVMSMGSCSNSGGPYWEHGYHVLKGIDRILPVDIFVPGCPPRPEAFFEGMVKLQEKISKQAIFKKRENFSDEEKELLRKSILEKELFAKQIEEESGKDYVTDINKMGVPIQLPKLRLVSNGS